MQNAVELVGGVFQQHDEAVHLGTARGRAGHAAKEHHHHQDDRDKFATVLIIKSGESRRCNSRQCVKGTIDDAVAVVVQETAVNHIGKNADRRYQCRHAVPSQGVVVPDAFEVAAHRRCDNREADTADEHEDDDHDKHITRMPVIQPNVLGGITACRCRRHGMANSIKPVHWPNKKQYRE